jgi:hypothetical protein
VTRAFYVKYLQKTLVSVKRDESRYRDSVEPGFTKLADHLQTVAQQTQFELDRVLEEPEGGDYGPDLAEFNKRVLYPKGT